MIIHLGINTRTKVATVTGIAPFDQGELLVYDKQTGIITKWVVPNTITLPRLEEIIEMINFSNN